MTTKATGTRSAAARYVGVAAPCKNISLCLFRVDRLDGKVALHWEATVSRFGGDTAVLCTAPSLQVLPPPEYPAQSRHSYSHGRGHVPGYVHAQMQQQQQGQRHHHHHHHQLLPFDREQLQLPHPPPRSSSSTAHKGTGATRGYARNGKDTVAPPPYMVYQASEPTRELKPFGGRLATKRGREEGGSASGVSGSSGGGGGARSTPAPPQRGTTTTRTRTPPAPGSDVSWDRAVTQRRGGEGCSCAVVCYATRTLDPPCGHAARAAKQTTSTCPALMKAKRPRLPRQTPDPPLREAKAAKVPRLAPGAAPKIEVSMKKENCSTPANRSPFATTITLDYPHAAM